MTQATPLLDPLQLRHDLKLARQEIIALRAQNQELTEELKAAAEELEALTERPSLLSRLVGPCLVALLLSGTFCATSVAIARGLDAFNIHLTQEQ